MDFNELKSQLARFHVRPQKNLGQNFLVSETVLEQILEAAELEPGDRVLEIGPGLGVLTERLATRGAEVWAVEKDRKLYQVLRKLFRNKKNIHLLREDALFFQPEVSFGGEPYKVVANIPYYLTGKLLQNFLTKPPKPTLLVLLLQREVAARLIAAAGETSLLSLSAQLYAEPEICARVPKENFYPVPEVDSAIVRLRVLPHPRFTLEEKRFFQLAKAGFASKRKQLHNNLQQFFPGRDSKQVLSELGLNPLSRAQDLGLSEWVGLYEKFRQQI